MSKAIPAKIESRRRRAVRRMTDGKAFATPEIVAYSVDGLPIGHGGAALTFSSLESS